ncbi:MAG: type II toxin-antitoxin system VapC family toxin [Nostocales cyanobacterium]|nr:MAG: type II toxin-antitoxin system VapC family toxin [Nostocales cyanobacterium]TAF13758.1 MAG: type II toxin-antitoxin system VapC family toxin [Nostocales cyanobacterium]
MILLDSDIVIDFLRKYPPAIIWLSSLGDEEIALPGYVAMELMQGCKNKLELQEIRKFIANVEVIWPTPETCDQALEIFANYHLSHNLGLIDALIGQTSIACGLPLHTFNVKHYAVIPGLITVQPYQRL